MVLDARSSFSRNVYVLFTLAGVGSIRASTIVANHPRFADDLTSNLYTNENEFTSAWGVSMAFDIAYPGSSGDDTVDQFQSVLGFPAGSPQQLSWANTTSRLVAAYDGRCTCDCGEEWEIRAPMLEVANSVWLDVGSQLDRSYSEVVGEHVIQTNFSDAGAGGVVNRWVEDSTHGLIDSIINEGAIGYALLVINSIYLNASWVNPFAEDRTNEDSFYASGSPDAATITSLFMHQIDYFYYSDSAVEGFQVIKLPFIESKLSMIIALPTNDAGVAATSASVLDAMPELLPTRVALALPKFEFESVYTDNLKTSLKSIGLVAPFEEEDAFCSMLVDECLLIGDIIQKTYINVHEKGTEAAAVTGMFFEAVSLPTDDPVLYMANHPFQFFILDHDILDQDEGLVLFEGRVGAPSIPDGASTAQMKSMHAEDEFWTTNFGVHPTVVPFEMESETTSVKLSDEEAQTEFGTAPQTSSSPANRKTALAGLFSIVSLFLFFVLT